MANNDRGAKIKCCNVIENDFYNEEYEDGNKEICFPPVSLPFSIEKCYISKGEPIIAAVIPKIFSKVEKPEILAEKNPP